MAGGLIHFHPLKKSRGGSGIKKARFPGQKKAPVSRGSLLLVAVSTTEAAEQPGSGVRGATIGHRVVAVQVTLAPWCPAPGAVSPGADRDPVGFLPGERIAADDAHHGVMTHSKKNTTQTAAHARKSISKVVRFMARFSGSRGLECPLHALEPRSVFTGGAVGVEGGLGCGCDLPGIVVRRPEVAVNVPLHKVGAGLIGHVRA